MDEQLAASGSRPLRGEEEEDAASPAGEHTDRDPYWDNVKGICVLMVVYCHTLLFSSAVPRKPGQEPLPPGAAGNNTQWDKIIDHLGSPALLGGLTGCLFTLSVVVMPGFTFVSGLMSNVDYTTPSRKRALISMGVTCIVNQAVSATPMTLRSGMPIKFYGGLGVQWFLCCLLFWRLTLPFWMMLRWPLTVSVILSLVANFTDTYNMYFHSFFCFMPFFIAGQKVKGAGGKEWLRKYRQRKWSFFFFSVVVLATVLGVLVAPHDFKGSEMGAFGYAIMIVGSTYGCMMNEMQACQHLISIPQRLIYYMLAVPMIPAFLGIIPDRHVWGLTRAGQMSMYIYLIHIWLAIPWILIAQQMNTVLFIPGAFLYAFFLWALLGTGCARPFCSWCVEPNIDWFINPDVARTWRRQEPSSRSSENDNEARDAGQSASTC